MDCHLTGTLHDMGSLIIGLVGIVCLVATDALEAAVSVPWAELGATGLPAFVVGIAVGSISGTRRRSANEH